jgi:hypothetical protein
VKIDWRAWLGLDPSRNLYLKMNEEERNKLNRQMTILMVSAPFIIWGLTRLLNWVVEK